MVESSVTLAALRDRLRVAGATEHEIAAAAGLEELVTLAADLGVRPKGAPLTHDELAARANVSPQRLSELRRAVGLNPAVPGAVCWFESDIDWIQLVDGAVELLGESVVQHLIRRAGWAMSQVAHASSEAFRVNVLNDSTPGDLDAVVSVFDSNLAATVLMDGYAVALGQIFRHQSRDTIRTSTRAVGKHGELVSLAVGFVDVASSTELGTLVSAEQLVALVSEFETAVFAAASNHQVRLVKTIGDEAMMVADDISALCRAMLDVVEFCDRHDRFTTARAGVTHGDVLAVGGDCYGPTVNRAARFVGAAPDGFVVADATVGEMLGDGLAFAVLAPQSHRGLGVLPWGRVTRSVGIR